MGKTGQDKRTFQNIESLKYLLRHNIDIVRVSFGTIAFAVYGPSYNNLLICLSTPFIAF